MAEVKGLVGIDYNGYGSCQTDMEIMYWTDEEINTTTNFMELKNDFKEYEIDL